MYTLNSGSVLAVCNRQFIVWRKLFWSSIATNIANPVLFLFAFGFGLGRYVGAIQGLDYMAFVVPGMVAYSAMFAASFETTIGSFSRYYLHRNWDAVLSTPVTLVELMLGEILWASFKSLLSAFCVLIVGWVWGGVPYLFGAVFSLIIVFFGSLCFASVGLAATAYARGYEFFSYFFTFWVTPMFVFCGVFFEISRFPEFIQSIAWFLPMTHLVILVRALSTNMPIDTTYIALHIMYIVGLSIIFFLVAYRRMHDRLFQ